MDDRLVILCSLVNDWTYRPSTEYDRVAFRAKAKLYCTLRHFTALGQLTVSRKTTARKGCRIIQHFLDYLGLC